MSNAFGAAVVAAVAALAVGVREWDYHQSHSYRPGPSGLIAVLGFAVFALALAVVYIAHTLIQRDR
jgi:hypothetical protein